MTTLLASSLTCLNSGSGVMEERLPVQLMVWRGDRVIIQVDLITQWV
ncbi:MAG: hypothetical protein RPU64_03375 [Candidatus Sedimenticola sp. (ex Thyasira tokunagai)]